MNKNMIIKPSSTKFLFTGESISRDNYIHHFDPTGRAINRKGEVIHPVIYKQILRKVSNE